MRMAKLCLGVVLIFLVGCGADRLDPRSARFLPLTFEAPQPVVTELSGGARLYLLEDRDLPLVRLYLEFRGGSLYDPEGKAGLSEVAESAWRTGGTAAYTPEAFDEALEDRAVALSIALGRETGWIQVSALSRDLNYALDLLEEILLRPQFREERVEWSVQQVQEGIRRQQDQPQALAFREFRKALYAGHPRGVIPEVESVGRVRRDDVQHLHRRLLEGGKWVLGAVGDFSAAELGRELESRFGGLHGSDAEFSPIPPPAAPTQSRLILVPKGLPQATVVWGRLGPARVDPDFYALDLADYVVGSGTFQSRLTREIRSNRGLAYSAGSFYQALPDFGVLGVQVATANANVAEVMTLAQATLKDVAQHGVRAEELGLARDAVINRHVFRYQDLGSIVQERMSLHFDQLPEDLPQHYPDRVAAVTLDDVKRVAARWYADGPGVTVVVGDLKPEELTWPGAPTVEVVAVGQGEH